VYVCVCVCVCLCVIVTLIAERRYIDKARPCLYKSLKSVHVCVSIFTLIQFYFHLNVLLFYRLEAEDEDQGIDSLEKELADVSWSDRIRVNVFLPELY